MFDELRKVIKRWYAAYPLSRKQWDGRPTR